MWQRLNKAPIVFFACGCILIAVLALTCGCRSSAGDANVLRTASGAKLHWSSTPIRVYVDSGLDDAWKKRVDDAIDAWNDALDFTAIAKIPAWIAGDSVPIFADDCDENPSSLANTPLFAQVSDGVIATAMVCLPVVPMDADAARLLVLHELGHLLGLGHDPEPDSVMYPYINADGGDGGRTIQQRHIDAVRDLYL